MATKAQDALIQALFEGTISRESFIRRAAAVGLSAASVAAFLGTGGNVAASSTSRTRPKALPRASADRMKTAIFDTDGGRVVGYQLFNPFTVSWPGQDGQHQAMIEPLFILNYGSGKIDPWLATGYTVNKTQDVWTIKLRSGVMWSDGQPFGADDVVFTLDMLKTGPLTLNYASTVQEWVKSVKKIDDLTVQLTLTKPNPRFLLSYLTVSIWGCIYIVPKHIWQSQDPTKFTNYDPAKGYPVFTGPYKLVTSTPTNFLYQRDPNWWGAKSGFMSLPAPEKLQWVANGTEDVRVALAAEHQLDSVMDITVGGYLALKAKNPNIIAC
jgi:peptide/nickel transport system substrate-binding protein